MTITINTPVALALLAALMVGMAAWAYETAALYQSGAVIPCTTDADCAEKNPHIRY